MYHTHDKVFIMDLKHYENGGGWLGSWKGLRYKASPIKEEGQEPKIQVEIWHQDICYELAEIEQTVAFPMTEDGVDQAEHWIQATAEGS